MLPAGGESLCLDFANTRFWRGRKTPTERLNGFDDVMAWLAVAGGLPAPLVTQANAAALAAGAGDRLLAAAIELREATYRIFAAVAGRRPVDEPDLAALNAALALAPPRSRLAAGAGGHGWAAAIEPSVPVLLAPVLWSAADLLTRGDCDRLRRCANDQCLWLFLDRSKTGTRRWCDMSACGNRAKAHRHYLKRKTG